MMLDDKPIIFGVITYDTHGIGVGGIMDAWLGSLKGSLVNDGNNKKHDLAVCLGMAGIGGAGICEEHSKGGKVGYGSSQAILSPSSRGAIGGDNRWRINNAFDFSRFTTEDHTKSTLVLLNMYWDDLVEEIGKTTGALPKTKAFLTYLSGRVVEGFPSFVANTTAQEIQMKIEFPSNNWTGPNIADYPESQSAAESGCGWDSEKALQQMTRTMDKIRSTS